MKKYIYYENSGRISFVANSLIENAYRVLEKYSSEIPEKIFLHYVKDGVLKEMPPAPSEYAQFNYSSETWNFPEDATAVLSDIRAKRDFLLSKSDWTQLPDVPLATKEAWAAYRQALRDITEQPDPFNIVWPAPPA